MYSQCKCFLFYNCVNIEKRNPLMVKYKSSLYCCRDIQRWSKPIHPNVRPLVSNNDDLKLLFQEFEGNEDQSSLVRHWLKPHLYARFVRFVPLTWIGQRCMRVELHGCNEPNLSMERLNKKLKNGKVYHNCKDKSKTEKTVNVFITQFITNSTLKVYVKFCYVVVMLSFNYSLFCHRRIE